MDAKIRIKTKSGMLIILLSILPLIDSLNGALIRNSGGLSLGMLYKFGLCGVLAILALRGLSFSQSYLKIMVIGIGYTFLSFCINYLIGSDAGFNTDKVVKLIFNIILLCLLLECNRKKVIDGEDIYKALDIGAWIMIICYIVPYLLKIGYKTYGSAQLGYKAFFYSQNEVGAVLVMLFYFALYKLAGKINFTNIIQSALLLFCCVLLNTKTALLGVLIGVFVWLVEIIIKQKIQYKLFSILVIILGVFVLKDKIVHAIELAISRMKYLNGHYNSTILSAILSGRDFEFNRAWIDLTENHFGIRFIFGNGFFSNYFVEMDIIDIFFYLGIIGAVAVTVFLIYLYVKIRKNCKSDRTHLRTVSFLVLFLIMNIAGHVLFMATAGCYFAIYCVFLLTYSKKDKST